MAQFKKVFGNIGLTARLLVVLMLLGSLLILPRAVSAAAITIDGNFSDWSGVSAFGSDANDAGGGSSDAQAVYLTSDGVNLYVRAQVWGTYSLGIVNIIYFDTDYNVATGFAPTWTAVGADYRLVHATAGFSTPTLQVHTGSSGSDTWTTVTTVSGAFSGNSAEYAIPYSAFSPALVSGGSVSSLYRASQDGAPDFYSAKPAAYILQSSAGGPTATNTPVGPTATRTNTPAGPTYTPTKTPTKTNTPTGPTNTPTKSPTRTNTPLGPTNTPGSGSGIINIDGNFSDWASVPVFASDPNDAGGGSSDAQAVYLTSDGIYLYVRAQVWGTYSLGIVNIIYLDTDYNVATGYAPTWTAVGADYRLIHTTSGFPSATLQVNNGGADNWTTVMTVSGAIGGDSGEYALPYSAFSPALMPGGNVSALYRASQDAAPHFYSAKPAPYILISAGPTPTPTRTKTPTSTPTFCATCPPTTTINYTASTAVITNPERGFDHTNTACQSSLYTVSQLQTYRNNENISLVLCNFYLTSFKTSPINQATLDTLQTQLNTIRAGGVKVVLRFSYSSTDAVDADLPTILGHISQLTPIIQANSDVIYIWQAGFIGQWGEWYYTTHFGNTGVISTQQWADRKAVVDAMLAALPSTRQVSLRTPKFMRTMYGTTTVDAGTAFNGSAVSRLGQHNDAFVVGPGDQGTYTTHLDPVEYPWLQAQSVYTVMGGENDGWGPPRTDCPTALQEMGMFHWSYINTDYYPATITNWNTNGCLVTMKQKLGYRFVLTQGTYPTSATVGGTLNVQISIRNDGYQAPINPRGRELILRNTSSGTVYRFPLTSDPRFWLAGTTTNINQTITLTGVPAGTYALLLNLPDPISALSTRPEYSIQTANTGTWEASTGFNNLGMTVTVH